eukprot:9604407-Karenia_brevis.AAC.1
MMQVVTMHVGVGFLPCLCGRFLPSFCGEFMPVSIDEKGAFFSKSKTNLRLELCFWQAAWDRYALAADILDQ